MEVVLVDNNSDDQTSAIAEACWLAIGAPVPLKLTTESCQGLTNARRAGVNEASYDIIIFCDDDNWLDQGYVSRVSELFAANPTIGIIGGQPYGVAEQDLPEWFHGVQELYACGQLHATTGMVPAGSYVFGAGLSGRRKLLSTILDEQWPMLCKDRSGKELSAGGDVEICMRATMLNFGIWYDEELQLKHFMPQQRLTREYCEQLLAKLPEHTFHLRKYDAFLVIRKMNWISRQWSLIYNFMKYALAFLSRNQHQEAWACDRLFFLTGLKWFATESTWVVMAFAKANKA